MIKTILMIICALALFFAAVMVVDNRRFVVRRYRIRSPKIVKPMRLVFIADLHERCYGNENETLVSKIEELSPEMILIGGDLIISRSAADHMRKTERAAQEAGAGPPKKENAADISVHEDAPWMKHSLLLVRRLSRICPVWFVRGNHETRLQYYEELNAYDAQFIREMKAAGVQFLENGCTELAVSEEPDTGGIRLCGLELPMNYYEKFKKTELLIEDLTDMIGTSDRSKFNILLTHSPVYFEQYTQWGADLCLCGHVHGGLMRLPVIGGVMGTRPNLFPKYSTGLYTYKTTALNAESGSTVHTGFMVLTCGLGVHTLPIRIFNPGEISCVELEPGDEQGAAV